MRILEEDTIFNFMQGVCLPHISYGSPFSYFDLHLPHDFFLKILHATIYFLYLERIKSILSHFSL